MLKLNFKKIAIRSAIIIVVLLGLSYITISILCKIYLQPKKIKEILISQVQRRFDRTITVNDDIELYVDWDMSPNIILHKFTLSNSAWATSPYIFTAETIDFNFSLVDLIFKRLNINSVKLNKPNLFIEINDKHNNLEDLQKDTNSPGETTIKLDVHKVNIVNGLLSYNGDKYNIEKLHLGIHNEEVFDLSVKGTHGQMPFNANLEITKMITYFKLNIIYLHVGKSDLSGDLAIEYSPVRITGNFNSKNLIAKEFMSDNPNPTGEYSIPHIEIPVDLLRGSKFDVEGKFNYVDLGGISFNNVTLKGQNSKDVLMLSLTPPATLANGKFSFDLKYDLNPKTPKLNLQAKTIGVKLSDLFREMFGKTPITGSSLDFTADLSGQGTDLKSLVNTMNGKILLQAGPGEFQNSSASLGNIITNVLTSIITFDKSAPSSEFKCGVINFKVTNGVANAKKGIGIEGANVNVLGNGMFDLRNGNIYFSMVPQTISANPINLANFSVAQLVEVNGTINNPKVSINAANVLAQSTTAVVATGLSTAGIGIEGIKSVLATTGIFSKNASQPEDFSPCKTALSSN